MEFAQPCADEVRPLGLMDQLRQGLLLRTSILKKAAALRSGPGSATPATPSNAARKSAGAVVGLGAVVVNEDLSVATVTEESPAQLADVGRGLHPAGGLGVELPEFLEIAVFAPRSEARLPWRSRSR